MAQNISVPDIGDFKEVEVIEVLVKPGDNIIKTIQLLQLKAISLVLKFRHLLLVKLKI